VFGEKDWQQLAVIRRMARDLDLTQPRADRIIGIPTVREADGLAMSSRNAYLTPEQRAAAATLNVAMRKAIEGIEAGGAVAPILADLEAALLQARFASVDYVSLADAGSLALLDVPPTRPARLLVAARIGTTRLIDNMPVEPVA
jgi:pantoate--beta-alanine ligase